MTSIDELTRGGRPEKRCVLCAQDVSNAARVKDARGRYMCQPCYDAKLASASRAAMAAHTDEDRLAPEDFLRVEDPPARASSAQMYSVAPATTPCQACGRPLAETASLCTHCGFDRAKGRRLYTRVGQAVVKPEGDTPRAKRASTNMDRVDGGKALMLFIVLFGLLVLIRTEQMGHDLVVFYVIGFAIHTILAVAAAMLCAFLWMGTNRRWWLTILRLAVVVAGSDLAFLLADYVPILFLPLLITILVQVPLVAWALESDYTDALMVALTMFVIKLVALFAIVPWLLGLGG